MLSDELKNIDWDRTPIRNFLDAKPTPKAVAGALIKLNLMSPSEVDDYDWSEIDYSVYPTVRRLLEDYAHRTPHSRLEDILSEAGRELLLKKGGYEEKPVVSTYQNPLIETFRSMEAQGIPLPPPEEVVKELANTATSITFLETLEPKLSQYIGKGEKPPASLLKEAMSKATQYALEALDELGMENAENTLKMKLKAGFVQNPVLRRYYNAKELSKMALDAMEEAGLIKRTTRQTTKKNTSEEKQKKIFALCNMIDDVRMLAETELPSEQMLISLLKVEAPAITEKIDRNEIKPSYLLQNPTGFLYAIMTNKRLACDAIERNPEKARTYLREIKELLPLLGIAVYELKMSKSKLTASLMMSKFTKSSAVMDAYAEALAKAIFQLANPSLSGHEIAPPSSMPVKLTKEEKEGNVIIKAVPDTTSIHQTISTTIQSAQFKIKHYVELLSTFFPNLSKAVSKFLENYESNLTIPSMEKVHIPSLTNPVSFTKSMMLRQEVEKGMLSPSLRQELEGFGIRIDGQVLLYNRDLLHRVEEINIPNYGWVNLKDLGIFLWYDPKRGIYYLQTAPGKLKMTTLPQAMRSIAKDLNISVPTQTVARNPREEMIMKLLKGSSTGGSWRTISTTGGGVTAPPEPIQNLQQEYEYIKRYPELIAIVQSAPNKELAVHRLYKMVTAFGPELVDGGIRFLKMQGYTEEDPEFVQLLDRVCYKKVITGRYSF